MPPTPRHIRIHAHGVDTSRGRWERALADSIFHWHRDSVQQTWKKVSSLTSHDTTNGRIFDLWSFRSLLTPPADTSRSRILERYDADGFLTFRQTDRRDSLHRWTYTRDSIQRGAGGMPLRTLSWSGSDGKPPRLVKDARFAWNDHSLSMLQATTNTQNSQGVDTSLAFHIEYLWSQGRLDSMRSELFLAGLPHALAYDAQGNVVTYSQAGRIERYRWNARRKIVSLRTVLQFSQDPSDTMLYSVDSFEYDDKGRIAREMRFPSSSGPLSDMKLPSISLYDYSIPVPVRAPARAVRTTVFRSGNTLRATGLPTGNVHLRLVRADGRQLADVAGQGEIQVDLTGLRSTLLLWSLEQDGRSLASGRLLSSP